ncbi:MAG: transporter associated domain-containing protein [Candidatus Binatia bacterium]
MPDSTHAVELLREMRRRHVLIAMVVDERGGMEGIVTMEDLVEELVGEIFSEHVKQEPELFRREAGGTVLLDGAAPVRDVNRALDLGLPEEEGWNSVAGLCLATAGRIPAVGDRLALANGLTLEIVDATPRRVRTVRAHPAREP